jgi:streptogramin lyase
VRRQPVLECLEERALMSGSGITEFSAGLTGHPSGLTAGPRGDTTHLYFGEQFNDRIGVFDIPTGQATEIQLPAGTGPHNIQADPFDPNLVWFSCEFGKIGSLNIHTLQVTFYSEGITPRPTPLPPGEENITGSKPDFLAFDPIHTNLIWFSEQLGGRLARFDRNTGRVTEFDLSQITALDHIPQNQLFPHGTIFTADGNAILIEITSASQIVKLDLSDGPINSQADFDAHLSLLVQLKPGSLPYDEVINPFDGNLYFTLIGTDEIGRYDFSTGTVTYFPTTLPKPSMSPGPEFATLIVGPDKKSLWFGESFSDRIGMLDPSTGRVTEFHTGITPESVPLIPIVGPDNNIWFTELVLNFRELQNQPRTGAPDGNVYFSDPNLRSAGRIAHLIPAVAEQFLDPNRGFVNTVVNDMVGHDASPAVLSRFSTALAQGKMSRTQVARALLNRPEVITAAVQRDYLMLLGRTPTPSELRQGVRFLSRGGALNQLEAQILGSRAFFRTNGRGTNAGFLSALFQSVFGRTPAPDDPITFSPAAVLGRPVSKQPILRTVSVRQLARALAAGVPRSQIAAEVNSSVEADQRFVRATYRATVFGPIDNPNLTFGPPDFSLENAFVGALNQGASKQQIIATMMGSPAYFQNRLIASPQHLTLIDTTLGGPPGPPLNDLD